MTRKIQLRMVLEVRGEDGSLNHWCMLRDILRSPDLQARCVEKRELRRVLKLIEDDPGIAKFIHDQMA